MKKYTTVKTVMKTHKVKWAYKLVLALFILSLFQGWIFFHPTELDSATLTNAKDVLENSRLSYSTTLNGDHSIGATTIEITTSAQPDTDTNHLFPGDTVIIDSGSYTVSTIVDIDTFTITSGLADGDNGNGDPIYVRQTATHTVSFTTVSAVADGVIRISIPATENDTNDSDTKPDQDGFDLYGVADSDITCPSDGGVGSPYDFESTEGEATDAAGGGWHTFQCRYSGSGSGSTALTMTIGSTNELINPAPKSGHIQGKADPYTIGIQNLLGIASDYAVVDSVDIKVVLIEAVRVTATVESSLSFTIAGRSSGSTSCGQAANITTTVYSVPFGSLSAANTFTNGAHDLEVSTNAADGYSVTVGANDQMGLAGVACTGDVGEANNCIQDTICDSPACDHTSTNVNDWETAGNNGLGYSLESSDGNNNAEWEYDGTSGNCDGTGEDFCAAQFADSEDGQTGQQIMSDNGPVDSENIYICYRISISGTQPAGNYYNTLTYIATPQF